MVINNEQWFKNLVSIIMFSHCPCIGIVQYSVDMVVPSLTDDNIEIRTSLVERLNEIVSGQVIHEDSQVFNVEYNEFEDK